MVSRDSLLVLRGMGSFIIDAISIAEKRNKSAATPGGGWRSMRMRRLQMARSYSQDACAGVGMAPCWLAGVC